VVNRSFADRYFANSPPIGHNLILASSGFPLTGEVRGIAADAREQGLDAAPAPTVYWCISAPVPDPHFLVLTRGEPMAMAQTVRRAIHQIEPGRSVFDVMPLEEHLSDAFAENRMRTILLSLFALTAISLACVGLYGTLSYVVALQHREIGLRIAFGAMRQQIAASYLLEGLKVAMLGCICGLALAAVLVRILSSMLFGVSSFDRVTLCAVLGLVFGVVSAAALIPALRASRTDPAEILREP
jgi:putative ABC transport system permease protein